MTKPERVPVGSGTSLRGADAFFAPEDGPTDQNAGTLGEQNTGKTVSGDTSKTGKQDTGKADLMKATYYITPEHDMKLERLRLAKRQQGVKVDKSALVRAAIDLLLE